MKQLTKQAYNQAVAYLKREARPLEQTLFAYHFEGGSAADVLEALAAFQNADGGFGHGLEPDIRLADSSVITTTIAFQTLREIGAAGDHPLVVNACHYLNSTYQPNQVRWPIVPANIDDAPHAPWWEADGDLAHSAANPRAEIAGYLWDYPEYFAEGIRAVVTNEVERYLQEQPDNMPMHDLLCYVRFWETPTLPPEMRARVLEKLRAIAVNVVARDPAAWREYGLPPLAICFAPDSPFAQDFGPEIEHNLDFLIESQGEQGAWMPNWSWFGLWPEVWTTAQREWSGRITLRNLLLLRRFGRIKQ